MKNANLTLPLKTYAISLGMFCAITMLKQSKTDSTIQICMGNPKELAAQYALYEVLYRMLQLLAPVTPHVTEEIYQHMFAENKGFESLQVSPWPKFNAALVDEEAEKNGDLIIAIIGEVRHEKAEKKLPLNAPVKNLVVYAGSEENAKVICSAKRRHCWNPKSSQHRSPR